MHFCVYILEWFCPLKKKKYQTNKQEKKCAEAI